MRRDSVGVWDDITVKWRREVSLLYDECEGLKGVLVMDGKVLMMANRPDDDQLLCHDLPEKASDVGASGTYKLHTSDTVGILWS